MKTPSTKTRSIHRLGWVPVLAGLALALSGCCGTGSQGQIGLGCTTLQANCCEGWDFYQPCDLIEGRAQRVCGNAPCDGPPSCRPAIVTTYCEATPSTEELPQPEVVEEFEEVEVIEEAPAEEGGGE